MNGFAWSALALALLLGVALALATAGAARWARATRTLMARLDATRLPVALPQYDAHELDALPAPVQRYFRAVLTDGQAMVTAMNMQHQGDFNLSLDQDRWRPFRSEQRVVMQRPGFVWNGHIQMFAAVPALAVHVHDAYIGGVGILKPSVLGLFALAHQADPGELARGELMRFVAEAAWYPTTLLPRRGVRWQAVDEDSAQLVFTDGDLSVQVLVCFDEADLIRCIRIEDRGMQVGDSLVPTPWEGLWSDYAVRGGMRVPMTCEVAWITPQGRKPYYRGTITTLEFEF